jgi:hypothetical protein
MLCETFNRFLTNKQKENIMVTQTPTQARAALAAAEQARDETQRAYHDAANERAKALDIGDIETANRWNAIAGERNVRLRFAHAAVQEAREGVDRANGELRRRLNAVASLSGETARVEERLREAEAVVSSLTPELAHLQATLAKAQALLAEFQADEPPPEPVAAPEPAQPVERDFVWPQPARVIGAGRSDARYFMKDGTPCDQAGRPLEGVEAAPAPAETPAKPDPMAPQSGPSWWD